MKLAAIAFIASLASAAQQITLSSAPGLAPAGITVTLSVSLVTGGGPAAVQWDMTGVPLGATFTTPVAGKAIACNGSATVAPTRCVLSGGTTAIPDGVIAQIIYTQPATPPTSEGLTAPLGATPAGAASAAMTTAVNSKCDVNSDGVINAMDVSLAIQQVLAAATNAQPTVVDVLRIVIAALGGVCLR